MLYQIVKLVTGINLVPKLRIFEALSFAFTRLHGVVLSPLQESGNYR